MRPSFKPIWRFASRWRAWHTIHTLRTCVSDEGWFFVSKINCLMAKVECFCARGVWWQWNSTWYAEWRNRLGYVFPRRLLLTLIGANTTQKLFNANFHDAFRLNWAQIFRSLPKVNWWRRAQHKNGKIWRQKRAQKMRNQFPSQISFDAKERAGASCKKNLRSQSRGFTSG